MTMQVFLYSIKNSVRLAIPAASKIVRRLVQNEKVRILDERRSQKKPRLLSAGKFFDLFVVFGFKIHELQNARRSWDQCYIFFLEKIAQNIL